MALALLLTAPALATGLIMDDYFHAVAFRPELSSPGIRRSAWDGYAFVPSSQLSHQLVEEGVFPWWSDPQARLSFFRPLSSLTLWLDHQLWPHAPLLMHLHSLLWFALLLRVIGRIYERFSGHTPRREFAALALLIYAIDDAHAMSVGWLANRSALIALTFGFSALLAHDSYRNTGQRRHLAWALTLLTAALCSAEASTQTLAYLFSYALFLDSGPKRRRYGSLAPYLVVTLIWFVGHNALEYGARGTGFYLDPTRDPAGYFTALCDRLPLLLAAQLGGLSADLRELVRHALPPAAGLLWPLALVVVGVCAWLFYPLWATRRELRFWTLGMLLSTLPVCAAAQSDRLLVATGLGGSAMIAILLLAAYDRARELEARARVVLCALLGVIHLIIAPLLLPLQAYALVLADELIARADATIPDAQDFATKTLVLLNPPSDEIGIYLPLRRKARGGVMPEHWRWLANGDSDLLLSRVDDATVALQPSRGFLPPGAFWTLRSPAYRSHVGERLDLDGVSYTVTEVTPDGRPATLHVSFDAPLDPEAIIWMRWDDRDGFMPVTIPEPGHSLRIPATRPQSMLLD